MADKVTNNSYNTFTDAFKDSQGFAGFKNENAALNFIDEFQKAQTIGTDLPARPASNKLEDVGGYEEPYELDKFSKVTNIEEGGKTFEIDFSKRTDIMNMRESWVVSAQKQDMLDKDLKKYRSKKIRKGIQGMGLDSEHDIFYGNPFKNPNQMLGLAPRFNTLTDIEGNIVSGPYKGMVSPYITLDAKGTAENPAGYASVYVVCGDADDGVTLIYPPDVGTAGIIHNSWGFKPYEDAKEGLMVKAHDQFLMTRGLAIMDRHSCVRIANINLNDPTSIAKVMDYLYDIEEILPPGLGEKAVCYAPRFFGSKIKQYFYNRVAYPQTMGDAMPKGIRGDLYIDNRFRFKTTFQLLRTEGETTLGRPE